MIILALIIIVALIAFSEIGLAALLVLPLTGCGMAALFGLLGLLIGAPGSGQVFAWGAGPLVVFFLIAVALEKRAE